MDFTVKEHGGISPGKFERQFFLKHFTPYRFSKDMVEGKKVLEIGFGDGYGSDYIASFTRSLHSVDLFPKNAVSAKKKYCDKNINFFAMNGYRLAFKKNVFDVIIAFQVIEHIPRDFLSTFLEEARRVLKDNGALILSTPNKKNLIKNPKTYKKSPDHDVEFTYSALKGLLDKHFTKKDIYAVDYSTRQKILLRLKKIGIFKFFPPSLNLVQKYFSAMDEKDFIVRKGSIGRAPDMLAVCFT